ncbi:MAG: NAD(P)/FAD-dependent oxidoreductase [Planctomycetota bacterium]
MDVIVVGAGAAGLAAAAELVQAGFEVVVLEARNRLGGRIHTRHVPRLTRPVELGAEFIHGRQARLFSLIARAGLAVEEPPATHVWRDGESLLSLPDFWPRIHRVVQGLDLRTADRSFRDAIHRRDALPALDRALATAFVEGYHAAPAGEISAASLKEPQSRLKREPIRQFQLAAGYDGIIPALAQPLADSIQLETVVHEIAWRPGQVEVSARGRDGESISMRARCALVTVPAAVLDQTDVHEGAIRFRPDLADKRAALSHLGSASVIKIALEFGRAHWEQAPALKRPWLPAADELKFLHTRDAFQTWWTSLPARDPLIVGWCGGPMAQGLAANTPGAVRRTALLALARLLDTDADALRRDLRACHTHDWQGDPFARGAYSFVRVHGKGARAALARPIDETLFFAGEATCSDGRDGTVDGAIASGHRAASEIRGMS